MSEWAEMLMITAKKHLIVGLLIRSLVIQWVYKMSSKKFFRIIFREFPIYYLARICSLLPNNILTCIIRGWMVAPFFGTHGKNFQLAEGSVINHPEGLVVKDNVYIAHRVYINASEGITINNNVTIGPNCILVTSNHEVNKFGVNNEGKKGAIIIGDGTWIGGNVTITPGVKIGAHSKIGACSVVTRDIPDNVMAAGTPAVVKKVISL